MSEIYISWSEYHHLIERLAINIYDSGWEFNQVVCLARGGLRVGDVLSRIYNLPLAILATSSYADGSKNDRNSLIISPQLTMTTEKLGDRILLVDDLVDSGITLQKTIPWLKQYSQCAITEIKTAVIWYKSCSVIIPDYYTTYLPENPWIHQPFEFYEHITPQELKSKIGNW